MIKIQPIYRIFNYLDNLSCKCKICSQKLERVKTMSMKKGVQGLLCCILVMKFYAHQFWHTLLLLMLQHKHSNNLGPFHVCWCPGSLQCQVISSYLTILGGYTVVYFGGILQLNDSHIMADGKWPTCFRQHFQMHLFDRMFWQFDSIIFNVCS